jgi:glycosyltransferase involved in cell wall biosynthesis
MGNLLDAWSLVTMTVSIPAQRSRVALVHDYMTQIGGAERVAGILAKTMPTARLLTSVHRVKNVPHSFIGEREWQTSFLQPLAGSVPLKVMLPVLPNAIASLDVSECDLVISSSSAFAHHVRPSREATHVCFCSSPAHFLWDQREYFRGKGGIAKLLSPLLQRLRRLDKEAAMRVDTYIANSAYTASRIRQVYGRDATVVYPPVDLSRFSPSRGRSGRFLVVSRLVPSKRVDLVIEAANRYALPLDVIGKGPEMARLRRLASPSVRMLGWQPDGVIRRAMAECDAVVVAGVEDFGLVTAEAQASGRPPVAFAAGGALEIIEDDVTGFLFREQTPEEIRDAMMRARDRNLAASDLVASAARFDVPSFLENIHAAIDKARRHSEPNAQLTLAVQAAQG